MPPRSANSPNSRTVSVREYPLRARNAGERIELQLVPTRVTNEAVAKDARAGTRCSIALTVVTTTRPPFLVRPASATSAAVRALAISGLGETRS